jgi:hypothetical protein
MQSFVIGLLGGSFLGMLISIKIVIKDSCLAQTPFEKAMILLCIAYVAMWWSGLLWLIFR